MNMLRTIMSVIGCLGLFGCAAMVLYLLAQALVGAYG